MYYFLNITKYDGRIIIKKKIELTNQIHKNYLKIQNILLDLFVEWEQNDREKNFFFIRVKCFIIIIFRAIIEKTCIAFQLRKANNL